LRSLDAYRGLIMVSLAFAGFGLAETAENHLRGEPDAGIWRFVGYQASHVPWSGCAFWDLIQPSFMFMVGVSMAYSYAQRQRLGHSYGRMVAHALRRSAVLIVLGVMLISNGQPSTRWSLMCVLTQIGLGYPLLFLVWNRRPATQMLTAAGALLLTWLLYTTYPYAGIDPDSGAPEVDVSADWAAEHLAGVPPAWHKNANVGHAIDLRLLNTFPRREPFLFNGGGYQTINFVPSLATMIFGLMAGEWLRSQRRAATILSVLVGAGVAFIGAGIVLDHIGASPIVKRIWTPAWTLFSAGICLMILACLYAIVDVAGWQRWTFPLMIVGVNSIAVYCMYMLLRPWIADTLQTHLGAGVFRWAGAANEPTQRAVMVGLVIWLIGYWMYRQRIFIRI